MDAMPNDPFAGGGFPEGLPGSHTCVGCGGLTFRQREDALCPRCAFETEQLMETIEIAGLDRDLELMTEFDAYYSQRDADRARFKRLGGPVFARRPVLDPAARARTPFEVDAFWTHLRDAS
jgi:hypothetical protein